MKHILTILSIILIAHCINTMAPEPCELIVKSKWKNLECDPGHVATFGGKWIIVGSLTFKKKTRDPLLLDKLALTWKGDRIDNLIGSLYRKNFAKEFIPIEDNLVCDGCWKKSEQRLILDFHKQHFLGAHEKFYVLLTVPEELEPTLRSGHFELDKGSLPDRLKSLIRNQDVSLTFHGSAPHKTNIS